MKLLFAVSSSPQQIRSGGVSRLRTSSRWPGECTANGTSAKTWKTNELPRRESIYDESPCITRLRAGAARRADSHVPHRNGPGASISGRGYAEPLPRRRGAHLARRQWAVFTVARSDLAKNRLATNLWRVSTAGGEPEQLTFVDHGSNNTPRWSPDGRYLYFLSSRVEDKPQVFRLSVAGGDAMQITSFATGVADFVARRI
jgi:hypothetical protein